jgi:dihydroorotate dehydrogenase electron transfer subunit
MKTSLPQETHVVEVIDENTQIRTFVFDLRLEAEPGQFVMAWLPGLDEKPFSLVCADPVTLTICRVGPFSRAVHGLRPGDRLWLRGPLGHGFSLPAWSGTGPRLPLLFAGGGYGVAPLHFLAEQALAAGWPVTMVIGARTAADVIFVERFRALCGCLLITTEDGSLGERGLATDAVDRLLNETEHQGVYACGPEGMLEGVALLAQAWNLAAQLSYERTMRCGFGVCGSCACHGWLVCKDGPVREK